MTSSESAPIGSTTPGGLGTGRAAEVDPDADGDVTTRLPPLERTAETSSRATRWRRGRAGRAEQIEGPEREPLFAPKLRPGRRVVRIVRHVQLWSVFKVALLGGLVFYVIFLITVGLGWSLANATGQVHHVERFMRQIGFDNWSFDGPQLFRGAALIGALLLAAGSVLITLGAAIVNLIAEATGGIRFTIIETDETDDDEDARPDEDPG